MVWQLPALLGCSWPALGCCWLLWAISWLLLATSWLVPAALGEPLAAPDQSWLLLAAAVSGCSRRAPGRSWRAPGGCWLLLARSWLLLAASWQLAVAPGSSWQLLAAPGGRQQGEGGRTHPLTLPLLPRRSVGKRPSPRQRRTPPPKSLFWPKAAPCSRPLLPKAVPPYACGGFFAQTARASLEADPRAKTRRLGS